MEIWTAFLLGLIGSLHCAGMCGPLALALPVPNGGSLPVLTGRVGYNLGRMTAYCLLGIVFGLAGRSVALAGLQRWASLAAGSIILLALIPAWRRGFALPAIQSIAFLKRGLSTLLRRRTVGALYLLGVLNGFLPCGLAYVACAGAFSSGSLAIGTTSMLAFGLGTAPMMLGISLVGQNLQWAIRLRFQRFVPVGVALVGVLLIMRGLALGIPYLSPDLASITSLGRPCH